MIISIVCVLVLSSQIFGGIEVIKIQGELDEYTEKYFWPTLTNGGIYIDSSEIYISNGNTIYRQGRKGKDYDVESIAIHGKNPFIIRELLVTKEAYYLTLFWGNGQLYLYKKSRVNSNDVGPVLHHGNCDRMLLLPNSEILATGAQITSYGEYINRYDNNSINGLSERGKEKIRSLYEKNKAFTLSFFDQDLNLIDSANVIERRGDDNKAFTYLWPNHPVDVSQTGSLYLIDNDNGYTIEKYESPYKISSELALKNEAFVKIPRGLTMTQMRALKKTKGSYSQVYALYIKDDYLITSFYESITGRDLPSAPYYYDISSMDGAVVRSDVLDYPIIAEDEADKVFLFVRRERGWFEHDNLYLVGLNLKDLLAGKGKKEVIDGAIDEYETKTLSQ